MLVSPFSSLRVSPQHLHPNPVGFHLSIPSPALSPLQGACLPGIYPAAGTSSKIWTGSVEKRWKRRGQNGECVLRGLVELGGTADKGRAVPAGIYGAALSTQGDEQSFFSWLLLQLLTFTYQIIQPCSFPSCICAQQSPLLCVLKGSGKWELCRLDTSKVLLSP